MWVNSLDCGGGGGGLPGFDRLWSELPSLGVVYPDSQSGQMRSACCGDR